MCVYKTGKKNGYAPGTGVGKEALSMYIYFKKASVCLSHPSR